jgi:hypothetical protein
MADARDLRALAWFEANAGRYRQQSLGQALASCGSGQSASGD